MKKVILFIFACCLQTAISAQSITGTITDGNGTPIDAASVILQSPDSVFMEATLSSADGHFSFQKSVSSYRLVVQHLVYQSRILSCKESDAGKIVLEEKSNELKEVVVKAERPFVKVEDGKLGYDLSVLAERKVVNNAYEALAELPGVRESEGTLSLAGTTGVTVMINGKPSTMTPEQLETLLRNTPVDRVEKAEVMYSAPPSYHVRGAAINVVLRRSDRYSFQGEVNGQYKNQFFSSGSVGGNFRLSTPKMAFDFMYSAADIKSLTYVDMYSKHTLNDKVYDIRQNQQLRHKGWGHQLRGAWEYNFSENSNMNLAYTTSLNPNDNGKSRTTGNFQQSLIDKDTEDFMHNLSFQYKTGIGLDVAVDYTRFKANSRQSLSTVYEDDSERSFRLDGGQRIDKLSVSADQTHSLSGDWNLGYGLSYGSAKDKDRQSYSDIQGVMEAQDTDSKLREQTTDFYVSLGKNYSTGTSFSLSATGEYYSIGSYHRWAFYPQASLTYLKSPQHIFQLSLSSDKTYPSYWDMQSSITYLDGYGEIVGTPGLRPTSSYNLSGSYILKQKYIFTLFYNHLSDYFQQAAYQSSDRLALIYQTRNWDYMRMAGVNVIIPFRIGSWLDSRLTTTGFELREKCDNYFDIPFDRSRWVASVSLDNTFKIGKAFSITLNGMYQSKPIQGTYDLQNVFDLSAGAKWTFAKGKATLSARCNDLFETGVPQATIRFKGQHLDMDTGYYTRSVTVHFSYRFGGYKEKERKEVDTSRFGH